MLSKIKLNCFAFWTQENQNSPFDPSYQSNNYPNIGVIEYDTAIYNEIFLNYYSLPQSSSTVLNLQNLYNFVGQFYYFTEVIAIVVIVDSGQIQLKMPANNVDWFLPAGGIINVNKAFVLGDGASSLVDVSNYAIEFYNNQLTLCNFKIAIVGKGTIGTTPLPTTTTTTTSTSTTSTTTSTSTSTTTTTTTPTPTTTSTTSTSTSTTTTSTTTTTTTTTSTTTTTLPPALLFSWGLNTGIGAAGLSGPGKVGNNTIIDQSTPQQIGAF